MNRLTIFARRRTCVAMAVMLTLTPLACLPYNMGATAATVPRDSVVAVISMSSGTTAIATRSEYDIRLPTLDVEARTGIDARSDMGVRVTSLSGLVGSYKRLLFGDAFGPAMAMQLEGGIVHLCEHGILGGSLLASGSEERSFAPYGGVRALALAPLRSNGTRSGPVLGGFAGLRLGAGRWSLLPELAVFRDPNQGDRRGRTWFVVPALGIRMIPPSRSGGRCRPGRWPQC